MRRCALSSWGFLNECTSTYVFCLVSDVLNLHHHLGGGGAPGIVHLPARPGEARALRPTVTSTGHGDGVAVWEVEPGQAGCSRW